MTENYPRGEPFATRGGGTNGAAKRPYRLSPAGLAALRANAERVKPWARSTGPVTDKGKNRSKMNALWHGERSAEVVAARKRTTALLRAIRELTRGG
ncbi:MAG: hypothetical protein JWO31_3115 [Phycisphaerales bacterium]|nr:hypothetical protein [Phycisphaerales bacterium]